MVEGVDRHWPRSGENERVLLVSLATHYPYVMLDGSVS